jgi:hypothetical protein
MQSEERKIVVSTILGKTLLYIVAVALAFALIVWAWEKYDWLPFVKDIIRGVVIPMLLGGLLVFLLRHEVGIIKDKWKLFVKLVVFLTSTLVFVNAGIIAQDACAKVMKVDSITTLSNEEIKRADYLQIESVEPDTSSCNYLFDDAVIPGRRSGHIDFYLYQVCPLKNKKGVFLCTRTKESHHYRWISEDRLQQWRTDFVNQEKGSIKKTALSAHFFKVLHQSDRHYEQYQAVAANCTTRYGVIRTEDLILLQICQPDIIKGWVDNVLYLFGSLLVGFSVLVITLMQTDALNGNFRKS